MNNIAFSNSFNRNTIFICNFINTERVNKRDYGTATSMMNLVFILYWLSITLAMLYIIKSQ